MAKPRRPTLSSRSPIGYGRVLLSRSPIGYGRLICSAPPSGSLILWLVGQLHYVGEGLRRGEFHCHRLILVKQQTSRPGHEREDGQVEDVKQPSLKQGRRD